MAPSCPERQFVWGLRYDDDLVLRDRVSSQSSSSTCQSPDERLYVLHDFFNATAVVNTGGTVLERYGYDAYGTVRFMDGNFNSRSSSSYGWETLYGAYRWDSETGLYQVRVPGQSTWKEQMVRLRNLWFMEVRTFILVQGHSSLRPTFLDAREAAGGASFWASIRRTSCKLSLRAWSSAISFR